MPFFWGTTGADSGVLRLEAPATITIQPADIRKGECGSATKCALALAAARTLHTPGRVVVDRVSLTAWTDHATVTARLTPELKEWIGRFDHGCDVEPLTITLPLVVQVRSPRRLTQVEAWMQRWGQPSTPAWRAA